jgi:hypothetical protein
MKAAPKKKRRPRADSVISFPRPVVPETKPGPEPTNGVVPLPRQGILDHLIVRRDTGDDHGEEKKIDHRHFADYGLERIPTNDEPHRVTLRSVWHQLCRFFTGPRGYTSTHENVAEPKRRWPS